MAFQLAARCFAHGLGLALMLAVATLPVGPWGFALLLAVLAGFIRSSLHAHRQLARRVWVNAHLKPEGPLARLLSGGVWLNVSSLVLAGFYAACLYATLYVYSPVEVGLVWLSALVASLLMERVRRHLRENLREESYALYREASIFHASVVVVLVALAAAKLGGLTLPDPAVLESSATLSEAVRNQVQHAVTPVQDLCRTLVYFDYQLERARLALPAYGWIIRLLFLFPNVLPLYAMIWFLRGVHRSFS